MIIIDLWSEGGSVPHAITARYDCKDNLKSCLEGTRTGILSMIHRWVEYGDVVSPSGDALDTDKLQTTRVFWINGPGSAGTGKSTIAYTIARDLDVQKKLGASFFCSRDSAFCNDPKLIFPTIAYQLGQFYPPFREEVSEVIKADPEIAHKAVLFQLERLLVKPLLAMKEQMPFCVVVIDALDECQDGGGTSTILSSLAQYIMALSPVKFLITSRPDAHIVEGFRLDRLAQSTQRYILHHVQQTAVEADLLLYLVSSLHKTRKMYSLDVSWPSMTDVRTLVHLSSGLFVFAATAAEFIQDRSYSDPPGQLARLLGAITAADSSPYECLDQLYLQVLKNAFPKISSELASKVKLVLGSVVLLWNPLSPPDLEQLLGRHIDWNATFEQLQSVVVLPNDNNEVIHLIHPSFHDFLTNPQRCSNPNFLITPELQHSFLAENCLRVMMELLKRDICNIQQPWKLHHELDNLPALVHQHLPQTLQYACSHWTQHLLHALLSNNLLDMLEKFCNNYLLYWVEACSLMGVLQSVPIVLRALHHTLTVSKFMSLLCSQY